MVASSSMLRFAQLLVLTLLPALGTTSQASALDAKTALMSVLTIPASISFIEGDQCRFIDSIGATTVTAGA
jgi:hypothetical protein